VTDQNHKDIVQKLFLRNSLMLQGFIHSLLPDKAAVEDVLHETFLVLTEKADDFTEGTDFFAWAKAVAYRKALQAIRAQGRTARTLPMEVLERLIGGGESVGFVEHWEERRSALRYCLEKLSGGVRRMLRLHYFEGLGIGEVARKVGWNRTSVSVAMSRGRHALRECVRRRMASAEGV
jgi:RNA polymerase sigma-70 factor (ECF subfamily)